MIILALDFSAPQRSVALRRDGRLAEAAEAGGRHTAAPSRGQTKVWTGHPGIRCSSASDGA
jgi:hypothetical protein